MTRDQLNTWIKALRSGEFAQCRNYLRCSSSENSHEYCCLGVLAEALGLQAEYGKTGQYVPICGILAGTGENINTFITLNDKLKRSFPQIADWLEQNAAKMVKGPETEKEDGV